MSRLTMTMFLTLDGVYQGPGGPTEDVSGGFQKGGWSIPFGDEDFGRIMGEWMDQAGGYVFGRKTYELMAAYWPTVPEDDPAGALLNQLPKYVASRTLKAKDLTWNNSHLLTGDIAKAVAKLKQEPGKDLQFHGSGELAKTLMAHNLIDRYRFWVYPVVLGEGKRLFGDGLPFQLNLIDVQTTSTGVVVQTYEPGGEVRFGSVL